MQQDNNEGEKQTIMEKCEYIILDTYHNNAIMCHKQAVYEIKHTTIFNDTPLVTNEYLCSKHAELKHPFTPLKRIVDNNEL